MAKRMIAAIGATLTVASGYLALVSGALAQEATPPVTGFDLVSPRAAIYTGDCGTLGADPVFSLGELQRLGISGFVGVAAGETDEPEALVDVDSAGTPGLDQTGIADDALRLTEDLDGALAPYVIAGGFVVDSTIDSLLGTAHALIVQGDTGDAAGVPAACGEIAGRVENGQLTLELRPVDRSGYFGYAVLEEDEPGTPFFGGEAIGVTIYLFSDLPTLRERGTAATPAAAVG